MGDDLLSLALSRPDSAERAARDVLDGSAGAADRSVAYQALGVVLRERGQHGTAIRHLRHALRHARGAEDRAREADVLASLGATLAVSGRTTEGEATLTEAAAMSTGANLGRVLVRRGGVLGLAGRHDDAVRDLTRAATMLRRANDPLWEARALQSRALSHLARGGAVRADRDLERAETLFRQCRQELESAFARHNRGIVARSGGDIPAALRHFAFALERYTALGAPTVELAIDQASALLASGMSDEAFETTMQLIPRNPNAKRRSLLEAELLYAAATAGLAAERPVEARMLAERAARSFRLQDRPSWAARARHVAIASRFRAGETTRALLLDASRNAAELGSQRSEEAVTAEILAGKLAASLGSTELARAHFERASRARRSRSVVQRTSGWLGRALASQVAGRTRATLGAASRGLDELEDYLATLGATELRSHATALGSELAQLALAEATRLGDGALILYWSERWRGIALLTPPVTPPRDSELARDVTRLRELGARIDRAMSHGEPHVHLARERRRLEAVVQDRERTKRGHTRATRSDPLDVAALIEKLGDTVLVELADVNGMLLAITVDHGSITTREVGSTAQATAELKHAKFLLRRLARGPSRGDSGALLASTGRLLQDALLGGAAPKDDGRPVVVVPPGRLQSAPWGMLPCFVRRSVCVAPSAAMWYRLQHAGDTGGGHIALIAGPGLPGAAAEIAETARSLPTAVVLNDDDATVEAALAAINGAALAHIAAHGVFRADCPMFSYLRLVDGQLTLYDLQRVPRAPRRVILTSCDSGVGAAVGADELLGLAGAMMSMGTAGVLASVSIVNDEATLALSLHVHARLGQGDNLPDALASARSSFVDDVDTFAAALSFLALGV